MHNCRGKVSIPKSCFKIRYIGKRGTVPQKKVNYYLDTTIFSMLVIDAPMSFKK